MEKGGIYFLAAFAFLVFLGVVSASAISNDIHVNIQTTYTNGSIQTGTFPFVFNISTSADCNASTVLYSNSATLTTDSNGLISYYLPNVDLPFNQQYWLCYYKSGTLLDAAQLSRSPYAFTAKNVTLSGVEVDTNFNLSFYNISQVNNINATGNVTASTGFFGSLGSLLNKIINLFAVNANFENLNVTNLTVQNFNYGGAVAKVNASGTEGAVQYNSNGELGGNAGQLFVNSSTGFVGVNTSSPQNLFNVNGGANITGVLIVEGHDLVRGYLYATNGTYYLTTNPDNFFNSSTLQNVSQLANDFHYYNSTTLVNVSQLANNLNFLNASDLPQGLTWAEVTNGTLYLSSNPYGFYNSSDFNISDYALNSSLANYYPISNPYGYINSSNLPSMGNASSTGSANYIPVFVSSTDIGNSVIYQNGSNVGIGTTNPNVPLTVKSDTNAVGLGIISRTGSDYGNIAFYNTSGTELADIGQVSDSLRFFTGGLQAGGMTEKMRIDSSGNVGIGTTSPGAPLQINGALGYSGGPEAPLYVTPTGAGYGSGINWGSDIVASSLPAGSDVVSLVGQGHSDYNSAYFGFHYNSSGSNQNYATIGIWGSDHLLNILGNGNVGIGTTSPGQKLTVVGNLNVTGNIYGVVSGGTNGSGTTNYVPLWTSGSALGNSVIYQSGGNVGIGTTNPSAVPTGVQNLVIGNWANDNGITITAGDANWGRLLFSKNSNKNSFNNYVGYNFQGGYMASYSGGHLGWTIQNTTGNVGIGTTSPSFVTSGYSGLEVTQPYASIKVNSTTPGSIGEFYAAATDVVIGSESNQGLQLITDSTPKVTILSGGNVGIGTTSPGFPLTVGTVVGNTAAQFGPATGSGPVYLVYSDPIVGFNAYYNGGWYYGSSAGASIIDGAQGNLAFETAPSGTTGAAATLTTRMYIAQGGNVGIGTTSPAGLLSVASGDAGNGQPSAWSSAYSVFGPNAGSTTGAALGLGYSNTYGAYINALEPSIVWEPLTLRGSSFSFLSDGATQGIYQDSSGNVGIGTTSPGSALEIAGSGGSYLQFGQWSGGGTYGAIYLNNEFGTSGDYNILSSPGDPNLYINRPSGYSIRFRENNADQVTIASGGYVGIGTTTPQALLDVQNAGSDFLVGNNYFGMTSGDSLFRVVATSEVGSLDLYNVGAQDLHLDAGGTSWFMGGDVGIGTSSPADTLDVGGTGPGGAGIYGTGNSYGVYGTGPIYGVVGVGNSYGVYGATASSGGFGVYGYSSSSSGYGGYFSNGGGGVALEVVGTLGGIYKQVVCSPNADCSCGTGYIAIGGGGYTVAGGQWLRESRPLDASDTPSSGVSCGPNNDECWRVNCADSSGNTACDGDTYVQCLALS